MSTIPSPLSSLNDKALRLIGPVVLFATGAAFFRFRMYLEMPRHLLLNQVIIALSAGYIGWELSRITALYLQFRFPGLQRITRRIIFMILALMVLSNIGYGIRRIAHYFLDNEPLRLPLLVDYTGATSVVIFYTMVTLGIYEGAYLRKQWKQTYAEKEKLLHAQWEAKYDLLKAQINPHFLFNSLNSLSSLIAEDPERAERYADEMSKVYRYLLRSNDQELVTLENELSFIRSYAVLLETRFGAGFQLCLQVPEKYYQYLIPSLTLQLLVENAVKHNSVAREQPLKVIIQCDDGDNMWVQNNVQKKNILVSSSGIGLKNINARFEMLQLPAIQIENTIDTFTVHIPLVKNSAAL